MVTLWPSASEIALWPQPTRAAYSSSVYVMDQNGGAGGDPDARDPSRRGARHCATKRRFVVGQVAQRGGALRDAVAESPAAMGDDRGLDRRPPISHPGWGQAANSTRAESSCRSIGESGSDR